MSEIEVGDYVNREKVLATTRFNEEDIKSIVTKEQFESIEYKI